MNNTPLPITPVTQEPATRETQGGDDVVASNSTPTNSITFPAMDGAEEALRRVQVVTDAALASLSLSDLLRELLGRLCELLSAEMAMLLLVTEDGQHVRLRAVNHVQTGFEESGAEVLVPLGRGVAGHIAAEHRSIIIEDLSRAEVLNPVLLEKGARSLIGSPLMIEKRLIGVVYVATTHSRRFSAGDTQVLQLAADRFAVAVERARLYDVLLESEQRKGAMLEAALDCIIMMDHEGLITEFNPAAESTFGYQRQDVIGRPLAEVIVPPALRERHWQGLRRYLESGEGPVLNTRIEIIGMRADGTEFPVELTIAVTQLHGRPAFTGFIRDITDRKRAESEREQLLAREQAARTQAEEANRAKDEFLATLSHELRTPLTPLLGWTSLLQDDRLDKATFKEGLVTIERSARAQSRLIGDLLDMSRIMTGKLRLDFHPIRLTPVIMAAIDTVSPAASAKRIELHLSLDPDADLVSGDAVRLQQVIWNLLSNAIKFTPNGGKIEVALERMYSYAEIRVTDSGEGIAPEFLPHAFEALRQADNSNTRRHGGLGLGLAIVRQLVESHGGRVEARSEGQNKGSTFIVRIPLRAVAATEDSTPPEAANYSGTTQHTAGVHPLLSPDNREASGMPLVLSGLHVLVVDDEADARRLVAAVLEQFGARATLAASAGEALEVLQRLRPDVLISDIGMAGANGYDLMCQIRGLSVEQNGAIPAIALTAYAGTLDRTQALAAGFQIHVAKPIEPATLIAAVVDLLPHYTGEAS